MDVRVGLKKAEHKRIDAFESWCLKDFLELCGSAGKESVCSVGDVGSIPGLGRSLGEGIGWHQFSSVAELCPTVCDSMDCSMPGFPLYQPTPRAYSNSCPLSRWCHPTISSSVIPFTSCLQSFPASGSSSESVLHIRWPKYWSFSFSISPPKEYSGLISFRMDWLNLLAVQGTLKSLLQHHSSKASILQCSAFFIVHCHIHKWWLEKP